MYLSLYLFLFVLVFLILIVFVFVGGPLLQLDHLGALAPVPEHVEPDGVEALAQPHPLRPARGILSLASAHPGICHFSFCLSVNVVMIMIIMILMIIMFIKIIMIIIINILIVIMIIIINIIIINIIVVMFSA